MLNRANQFADLTLYIPEPYDLVARLFAQTSSSTASATAASLCKLPLNGACLVRLINYRTAGTRRVDVRNTLIGTGWGNLESH